MYTLWSMQFLSSGLTWFLGVIFKGVVEDYPGYIKGLGPGIANRSFACQKINGRNMKMMVFQVRIHLFQYSPCQFFKIIASGKLTWQLKFPHFNRRYIFTRSIFCCHVSLLEGNTWRILEASPLFRKHRPKAPMKQLMISQYRGNLRVPPQEIRPY